ncbi:MAG TPA: hypothetical protein VFV25_00860 [Methylibium sp.]
MVTAMLVAACLALAAVLMGAVWSRCGCVDASVPIIMAMLAAGLIAVALYKQ